MEVFAAFGEIILLDEAGDVEDARSLAVKSAGRAVRRRVVIEPEQIVFVSCDGASPHPDSRIARDRRNTAFTRIQSRLQQSIGRDLQGRSFQDIFLDLVVRDRRPLRRSRVAVLERVPLLDGLWMMKSFFLATSLSE